MKKESPQSCSKHFIGNDRQWEDVFTWLEVVHVTTETGKAVDMYVQVHVGKKHKMESKYSHKRIWSQIPFVCMPKDSTPPL